MVEVGPVCTVICVCRCLNFLQLYRLSKAGLKVAQLVGVTEATIIKKITNQAVKKVSSFSEIFVWYISVTMSVSYDITKLAANSWLCYL